MIIQAITEGIVAMVIHQKTVILEKNDTIDVQVPRDLNSTFESVIIPKHE